MCSTLPIRCFALLVAALLSACASIAPPAPVVSEAVEAKIRHRFESAVQMMAVTPNDSPSDATPANLKELMSSGMALSDLACKNFFRSLGRATQDYAFARQETALAGGAVASLQGLTGVSAKIVSITAGLFSLTSASMENHADAYLFSPETSNLQELVDSARRAYREAATEIPATYGAAIERLRDYDKLCEVQTIRRLVNESVATAKPIATGFKQSVLTSSERAAIGKAIGRSVLTMDESLMVYWYLLQPVGSRMDKDKAKSFKGPWDADQIQGAINAKSDELRKAFAPAIERDNGQLNAALDELAARIPTDTSGSQEVPASPTLILPANTNISVRIDR